MSVTWGPALVRRPRASSFASPGGLTGMGGERACTRVRTNSAPRGLHPSSSLLIPPHPSSSLAQARQHLEPGIAIGRFQADFLLIAAHCSHSVRPNAPIGTTWIEA